MIEYTYTSPSGLEIKCELEFEEADAEVGFPASAYLYRAYVGGKDISGVMDSGIITTIEEAAVCYMRESHY